jgi:hypothetical protein
MAKNDQKEKREKSKQNKVNKTSAHPDSQIYASGSTYADGTPLDRVQYLEAKLILKPDRFTSVQSFREFGKIVKRVTPKSYSSSVTRMSKKRRPWTCVPRLLESTGSSSKQRRCH